MEAELLPAGKDNPWGNAFVKKETDLVDESTSGRIVDCLKARFWKIKNPAVCHEYSGRPKMPMPMPLLTPCLQCYTGFHPCKAMQPSNRMCMKHSCCGSSILPTAVPLYVSACHRKAETR